MKDREYVKRRMKLAAMDAEEDIDRLHPRKHEVRRGTLPNGKPTTTLLRYRTAAEWEALLKIEEVAQRSDRFGRIHRLRLPA